MNVLCILEKFKKATYLYCFDFMLSAEISETRVQVLRPRLLKSKSPLRDRDYKFYSLSFETETLNLKVSETNTETNNIGLNVKTDIKTETE